MIKKFNPKKYNAQKKKVYGLKPNNKAELAYNQMRSHLQTMFKTDTSFGVGFGGPASKKKK